MKFTQLSMAVLTALFAGQVLAAPVTISEISTARSEGNLQEAWISGATAPTFNVFLGFAYGCDKDTLSFFHGETDATALTPGSSKAKNDLAYACTRGGNVSVLYHTTAGSLTAYTPHTQGATLTRLKSIDSNVSTNCTNPVGITFHLNDDQNAVPVYNKCAKGTGATLADGSPAIPAGGFSDVEAALFGQSVGSVGEEKPANVGQVFGVAVSRPLYRALQVAQGIANNTDSLDPEYSPANAPNINSAQYTALITGGYVDWSGLIAGDTTSVVRIGRRDNTSGTQASSNAYFLKNPCNGNPAIGGILPPQSTTTAQDLGVSTYVVTEDASSSNLKTKFASTTDYVIGVLSLENNWRTASEGYRYVKLDNVHPEVPVPATTGVTPTFDVNARYTAVNGHYGFHMEMVSFVANTATGFGQTVIGDIVSAFASMDCTKVPRGLTLNPLSGSACTPANQVVAKMTRYGNNCQASQMLF